MNGLQVNRENCRNAFRPELFATDDALALALKGVPFREAYQRVAHDLDGVRCYDLEKNLLSKTHLGATGNLGLALMNQDASELNAFIDEETRKQEALFRLLG